MNPGGSVKDRIGLRMIEQAEADGRADARQDRAGGQQRQHGHRPGDGLRGQGLPAPGHDERIGQRGAQADPRAYGAQILLTPGYRGTDGAIEEAYRLAREEPDKYVLVDQFNNDANWQAHYEGTGREIWEATGGKVDVVVITMGTTGTLMGTTRALQGTQSGGPRRRRRAVQGPQDPGPQEHEGELPAGDLQAGGAARDRQRGRRFGLRDGPAPGAGRGDLRGHERRGGHEGGRGRGPGAGPGHRRGPAARRRRALSLHLAVRLRDRARSRCASTTRCPARWNSWSRSRRARSPSTPAGRAWTGRPTWGSAAAWSSPTCCGATSNAAATRSSTP